jgi:hypothetical protein
MPKDQEDKLVVPVLQDVRKQLTRADLLRDAGSLIYQANQFYLPGEVEISVAIAFRGDLHSIAFSTSVVEQERLRWTLKRLLGDVPKMGLVSHGKKGILV